MKKWFGITFILVLLLTCLLPTKAEAATSGYYTYTVSNGKATITKCNTSISGNITIPSTLGGYPVTSIGSYAFCYCSSLTNITIPESVTNIGDYTFRWLTEQVNANYTDYTNDQITQFKAMLQQFDIVKKWDIPNII